MDDNIVGLAAVVMCLGIPMAAMYTYYRVKRLRTEERLAEVRRLRTALDRLERDARAARAVRPGVDAGRHYAEFLTLEARQHAAP